MFGFTLKSKSDNKHIKLPVPISICLIIPRFVPQLKINHYETYQLDLFILNRAHGRCKSHWFGSSTWLYIALLAVYVQFEVQVI